MSGSNNRFCPVCYKLHDYQHLSHEFPNSCDQCDETLWDYEFLEKLPVPRVKVSWPITEFPKEAVMAELEKMRDLVLLFSYTEQPFPIAYSLLEKLMAQVEDAEQQHMLIQTKAPAN